MVRWEAESFGSRLDLVPHGSASYGGLESVRCACTKLGAVPFAPLVRSSGDRRPINLVLPLGAGTLNWAFLNDPNRGALVSSPFQIRQARYRHSSLCPLVLQNKDKSSSRMLWSCALGSGTVNSATRAL